MLLWQPAGLGLAGYTVMLLLWFQRIGIGGLHCYVVVAGLLFTLLCCCHGFRPGCLHCYAVAGRAWLYLALQDYLLESYLRCVLEQPARVLRFYHADALLLDQGLMHILLTLISGLETFIFSLQPVSPDTQSDFDTSIYFSHFSLPKLVTETLTTLKLN